jgi:hypothetical protein
MDEFERAVLRGIIPRHAVIGPPLRIQIEGATVSMRTEDAEGRTTLFCVADDVPRVMPSELQTGDEIRVQGVSGTAYAEVQVRGGLLHSLRVTVFHGPWTVDPVFLGVEEEP